MNTQQIETLANKLISQHLHGWRFSWNKRSRTAGLCVYGNKKEIQLSSVCVNSMSREQIEDTILHEIAHAIAGYSAAHGPAWKRVCVQIGAKPVACIKASELDDSYRSSFKYVVVCETPGCKNHKKILHGFSRKVSKKYICTACNQVVKIKQQW